KPDGGYESFHDPIAPGLDAPYMNDPDPARWIAADVGGPTGAPDGRSDLIRVSRDVCTACPGSFTTLSVVTLLSTPTGWAASAVLPWSLNGATVPYSSVDTQNWRVSQLNGDDRADLVHFVPSSSGVTVEYLLASG